MSEDKGTKKLLPPGVTLRVEVKRSVWKEFVEKKLEEDPNGLANIDGPFIPDHLKNQNPGARSRIGTFKHPRIEIIELDEDDQPLNPEQGAAGGLVRTPDGKLTQTQRINLPEPRVLDPGKPHIKAIEFTPNVLREPLSNFDTPPGSPTTERSSRFRTKSGTGNI